MLHIRAIFAINHVKASVIGARIISMIFVWIV